MNGLRSIFVWKYASALVVREPFCTGSRNISDAEKSATNLKKQMIGERLCVRV